MSFQPTTRFGKLRHSVLHNRRVVITLWIVSLAAAFCTGYLLRDLRTTSARELQASTDDAQSTPVDLKSLRSRCESELARLKTSRDNLTGRIQKETIALHVLQDRPADERTTDIATIEDRIEKLKEERRRLEKEIATAQALLMRLNEAEHEQIEPTDRLDHDLEVDVEQFLLSRESSTTDF